MPGLQIQALQAWFKRDARQLPWRLNRGQSQSLRGPERERHLYHVWLSEVMLQQTQVVTVVPYFLKFTKRFDTVQELARASIDEIYELWAGLGYYSRARNLHRGAQAIAARLESGKGFPSDRTEWLEIPGVGPYTAGAICSIALHQREPIVDGNVVRVLSRWYQISKLDAKYSEIWAKSTQLVQAPEAKPSIFNQALMELGATVCKPRNPKCESCPVALHCHGKSRWEHFPPKKKRAQVVAVSEVRHVTLATLPSMPQVQVRHYVLLTQNERTRWRTGLWDFLTAPPELSLLQIRSWSQSYQVTKHRVQRENILWEYRGRDLPFVQNAKWWPVDQLPGVPAPVKKALGEIIQSDP